MNDLQKFDFQGNGVRVVMIDGDPWFVASDVARVLGYANPQEAVRTHCKGVRKTLTPSRGGEQEASVIPERDVYRLIMRSRLPEAERFEEWVVGEVLPSIRKTGGFGLPQTFAEALQLAADQARQIEEQEQALIQAKPKVDFFDSVANSKSAIPMNQVSKILERKGFGRNKLFAFLRDKSVLRKNNEPYQSYVDRGWFRVVEQKYTTPDGETHISIKTLVYQKGVDGIRRLLDAEAAQWRREKLEIAR